MRRIIVAKFSSQYFNIEKYSTNKFYSRDFHKIRTKISYELVKIFEGFDFKNNGLVVISSGSVILGKVLNRNLNLTGNSVIKNAVYASLGQPFLMEIWKTVFNIFDLYVSQILVDYTHESDKNQINHLKDLIFSLINNKIIPIVNFNDSMSGTELRNLSKFVDNDKTFEFIINLLNDIYKNIEILGVIFSDRPLQKVDDNGEYIGVIPEVIVKDEKYKDQIIKMCNGKSMCGTGGMKSKVETAWRLIEGGKASKIIISGYKNLNNLLTGYDKDITVFKK